MKIFKNNMTAVLFFSCVNLFSFDMTTNQKTAVSNIAFDSGMVAALAVGSYLAFTYDLPEDFYVKNQYPYAQMWYNEMADKYPQACLHKSRFLYKRRGDLPTNVAWESTFNDIYAHPADLEAINEIYIKKSEQQELTNENMQILYICEFLLLHEAGHVQAQDSWKRFASAWGLALAAEGPCYLYREHCSYNPLLFSIFGWETRLDYALSNLIQLIVYYTYVRHTEAQADKFAYENADSVEVLEGGVEFFNHVAQQDILDLEHPEAQSRAQAILDEIAQRKAGLKSK